MQKKTLTTKQYLGMIALFLIMELGMVAMMRDSQSPFGGTQVGAGEYDALLATMNTEASDTIGDYYELLLTMNTAPQKESSE